MNREIKFRAWNGSEMVYDITAGKFGTFYVNPGSKGDGLDEKDSASLTPFNTKFHKHTPIMQYSGLRDCKETDIYEGDVVKIPVGVAEVIFENGCFYTPFNGSRYRLGGWQKEAEIIGNIYEHPHLLTP